MSDKKKKFLAGIENSKGNWLKEAKHRRANKKWLRKSQRIAIHILHILDEKGMQQKVLAEKMGVSPQQISKIVKGKQNLTLETISKLEEVLGITLIEIPKFQDTKEVSQTKVKTNIVKKDKKAAIRVDNINSYMQIWDPTEDGKEAA